MVTTISYSQRKGGPRRVCRIYKCRMVGFDKSVKHATIQQPMADSWMQMQVLGLIGLWGDQLADDADVDLAGLWVHLGQVGQQIEQQQELANIPGIDMRPIKAAISSLIATRDGLQEQITVAMADSTSLAELVGAEAIIDEDGRPRTVSVRTVSQKPGRAGISTVSAPSSADS